MFLYIAPHHEKFSSYLVQLTSGEKIERLIFYLDLRNIISIKHAFDICQPFLILLFQAYIKLQVFLNHHNIDSKHFFSADPDLSRLNDPKNSREKFRSQGIDIP